MPNEYPPYTPMPSLSHELGLILGLPALCIVVMGVYITLWRVFQTRLHTQDLTRRKAFHNKTPIATKDNLPRSGTASDSKPSLHEKMLGRFTPHNRAELPVHGMEMYGNGKGVYANERASDSMTRVGSPLGLNPGLNQGPGSTPVASRAVSPVGDGRRGIPGSIVGVALGSSERGQSPARIKELRSASPARRFGGGISTPVEIGPAPTRE
ncbi:uncharacterized protein N7515_009553 [Penicillium bovifimosum]|uniref:Uncharacterized protein n=1 Tax=Penicillium bovifimosum TaxID=126998 RepID=A0A9W9GJI7_9EURO|nr:uncharacterized protein N7515_009553 [Penicillium bovifimosum]KAJ5121592.1 hypothetical protein N7515_009553 [Penicillium bovifimosum]